MKQKKGVLFESTCNSCLASLFTLAHSLELCISSIFECNSPCTLVFWRGGRCCFFFHRCLKEACMGISKPLMLQLHQTQQIYCCSCTRREARQVSCQSIDPDKVIQRTISNPLIFASVKCALCLKIRCEETPCCTADVGTNELEALNDHYLIGGKGVCKDSLPPAFCGHKSDVIKLHFANPLCSCGMMPIPAVINLQRMSHQLILRVFCKSSTNLS